MMILRTFVLSETRPVKIATAVAAGFACGFLLYLITSVLLYLLLRLILSSIALNLSLFLESWVFSAFLVFRKAKTVAEVIARSLLLGGVLWAIVFVLGLLRHGTPLLAAAMSLICLGGFALMYRVRQQAKQAVSLPATARPQAD